MRLLWHTVHVTASAAASSESSSSVSTNVPSSEDHKLHRSRFQTIRCHAKVRNQLTTEAAALSHPRGLDSAVRGRGPSTLLIRDFARAFRISGDLITSSAGDGSKFVLYSSLYFCQSCLVHPVSSYIMFTAAISCEKSSAANQTVCLTRMPGSLQLRRRSTACVESPHYTNPNAFESGCVSRLIVLYVER